MKNPKNRKEKIQKKQKRKIQKKIEKKNSKKSNKKENPKKQKKENPKKQKKEKFKKSEKSEKSKIKKKKNLFSVVLDKICVLCLYPIPDSQQYVKRGSCRRPILSGLRSIFSFWALGPFVIMFELGPRTLLFSFLSSL